MRWPISCAVALLAASVCVAENDDTPTVPPQPIRPLTAPAVPGPAASAAAPVDNAKEPARFSAEAKWQHAGYNLDEIVYTITITSQDSRILRCRTEIKGFSVDNTKRSVITDLQVSTVFPDQQVQAGTWTGLDEKSGATYTVRCKAI